MTEASTCHPAYCDCTQHRLREADQACHPARSEAKSQDLPSASSVLSTLPPRWAQHPIVVTESAHHDWDVLGAWYSDDALVLPLRRRARSAPEGSDSPGIYAIGTPDGAARLILDAANDPNWIVPGRTSIPFGTRTALANLAAERGVEVPAAFARPVMGHWNWWYLDSPPVVTPAEDGVAELTDIAEITAALESTHPGGELRADEPRSRWFGWRDDDGVVRAIAGADRRVPGRPWVLGSIGVTPAWRGRGLGVAVTAAAARVGLAEADIVTLSMYAGNIAGAATYTKVGFTMLQEFESEWSCDPEVPAT